MTRVGTIPPPTVLPGAPEEAFADKWPWNRGHLDSAWQVWHAVPNQQPVLVAVIDDGFDLSHSAFEGKLWEMPGRPEIHGWDCVTDTPDPTPDSRGARGGHGTRVAGILGGRADRAHGFTGAAPNAKLMLLRWRGDHPPNAHDNPLHLAAALRFAIAHGARVVNFSGGIDTTGKSSRALAALRDAFEAAATRGILVVIAAPNLPQNMDEVTDYLPGVLEFDNIIHVTGLTREGDLLGAWGAATVDLAAPAQDIWGPVHGGGYAPGSATSFATPLVAGAATLVWGLMPKLLSDHVRRLLLRCANPVSRPDPRAVREARSEGSAGERTGLASAWGNKTWGRRYPATAQGSLDLAFLNDAWEHYRNGDAFLDCFPAGVASA